MQAECIAKLQSSLERLNITVKPVSTINSELSSATRVVTANGEFVFRMRHHKMIQKLTQRYCSLHTF